MPGVGCVIPVVISVGMRFLVGGMGKEWCLMGMSASEMSLISSRPRLALVRLWGHPQGSTQSTAMTNAVPSQCACPPPPVLSSQILRNNFHKIENKIPCSPFAIILVFSPLPNNPIRPSCRTTRLAASVYEICVECTCRYVFTTRNELEIVSDATDAQNPIKAARSNQATISLRGGSLIVSDRKLYVANQG